MPAALFALYAAAACAGTVTAVAVLRRREVAGRVILASLFASAAWWALCDAVDLLVSTASAHRLVSQLQYVGVVASGPLLLLVALLLAGFRYRPGFWSQVGLWTMPVVTLAVAWTNGWHRWLWTAIEPRPGGGAVYHYGWFFWAYAAWHYALFLVATGVVLVGATRASAPVRGSLGLFLLAVSLPYVGSVLYNFKVGPWVGVDWTSIAVNASAALLAWGILREGMLDLVPVARATLIETMGDPVLLVGTHGRVLHANPAADALFGPEWRGGPRLVLESPGGALDPAAPVGPWTGEVHAPGPDGAPRWYDVRVDPVADRWGRPAARLLRLQDVTARKAAEAERERLIEQLTAAAGDIRTLERLVPICARCKKIRDDGGYWQQLEAYLASRMDMRFTHGLCPACVEAFGRDSQE